MLILNPPEKPTVFRAAKVRNDLSMGKKYFSLVRLFCYKSKPKVNCYTLFLGFPSSYTSTHPKWYLAPTRMPEPVLKPTLKLTP